VGKLQSLTSQYGGVCERVPPPKVRVTNRAHHQAQAVTAVSSLSTLNNTSSQTVSIQLHTTRRDTTGRDTVTLLLQLLTHFLYVSLYRLPADTT